jgi:hypothetical protein
MIRQNTSDIAYRIADNWHVIFTDCVSVNNRNAKNGIDANKVI